MLTYRLLGALEVARAGQPIDLGGPKQRAVLAALLLDAGRIVSADRLTEAVWGDEPTAGASATLQVYVSNLRRALRDGGGPGPRITRRSPGYLIDVQPEAVDAFRFVVLTEQTQRAADDQDWRSVVARAREALELWRGPLLADLGDQPWVSVARVGFDERHAVCRQHLVAGLLGMGDVDPAVTRARRLFVDLPLSERAAWLYILALHRSGRSAEALDAYRNYAQHLSDELGLDVGPPLRDLHAAILRRDVQLDTWPNGGAGSSAAAEGASTHTAHSPPDGSATKAEARGRAVPRLREREFEVGQIGQLQSRAKAGVGGALFVWGPAGIGKSALLAQARATAADAGMRVLRARGAEMEREFGFGVARQLLEPVLVSATAGERAAWLDGLAGHAVQVLGLPGAGTTTDSHSSAAPSFQVLHGLYWLCAEMAESRPTCLVIDDAQWADVASLRFLKYLLPRLSELPLAVIAAARAGEAGPATQLLDALAADPECQVVELAPLSRAAVGQILHAVTSEPADSDTVRRLHIATAGNPFLVEQMAGQLRQRGDAALSDMISGAPPGSAVARWVQTCLNRFGEAPQRLSRAVAILETAPLTQAAELAAMGVEEAGASWDMLVEAEILNSDAALTFTHPLVRAAVYDALGRAGRSTGHQRAARILDNAGAAPQTVAEHLLAAAPAADNWVVERLTGAATEAARSGAPESAAAYLTRAVAEPPVRDRRSATLLALGIAELNAGLPEAITHLQQSVEAATDSLSRASAAAMFTCALAASNDERLPSSADSLDKSVARLREADPAVAAAIETFATGLMRASLDLTGQYRSRMQAVRRLADDPLASGDVLALAALIAHKNNERAEVVQDLARRSLQTAALPLPGPLAVVGRSFLTIQAQTALLISEAPDAISVIQDAIEQTRESGDAFGLSASLALRGWHSLFHGDLRGVEVDATTALKATGLPAVGFFRLHSIASLATALIDMDRVDEAAALTAAEPDVGNRSTLADNLLRLARGRVCVARKRPAEALAYFLAVGQAAVRGEFDGPSLLPWRSAAALAHLVLGDRDRAWELALAEVDLARAFGAPRTLGVATRVLGLASEGHAGEQLLRESIGMLASAGAGLDQAYAMYDLGARLRQANQRSESRELLRSALDIADRVGAASLAEHALAELRVAGGRPRRTVSTGPHALTASERRVVDLAADGSSNREIAQTLFVTGRTVEGHLTSAFRKLGISSREDLRTALAAGSVTATATGTQ